MCPRRCHVERMQVQKLVRGCVCVRGKAARPQCVGHEPWQAQVPSTTATPWRRTWAAQGAAQAPPLFVHCALLYVCVCARARLLPLSCCLCGKLASPVVHTCAPNRAHAHARTHAGHAELVHDQRGAPPGRGIPPQQHHHKRAASPRCVAAGRECAQQVGSVPQQIVSARSQLRVRAAGRVCATASRKFAAASRGCAAARAAWRTAPAGSGAPV